MFEIDRIVINKLISKVDDKAAYIEAKMHAEVSKGGYADSYYKKMHPHIYNYIYYKGFLNGLKFVLGMLKKL